MEEEKDIQTETATENAGNVETQQTEQTGKSEPAGEKTYSQKEVDELLKNRLTQEQVNEIIEKRLAREKGKAVPTDANNGNNSELVRVKGEVQNLQLKLAEYEKKVALAKYRIDEKYQDYVNYKVLHSVSKDKDYATALEEFFKDEENKRYLEGAEIQKPTPRPKNSNSLENEKATDNNLRAMFGLGKK